ncbi:peroxiredoxin family protein [Vibrio agarivorans]|uniref:peroxiredoxin family protein n=1 Tax=Vibrio agarivorans TaxID=153622 RepID=UPI002232000C|nr:peroxiredoxin family protein [Vibrio agarivorans]MDN3663241.1 peroxiredoxin family protein [Vibrio agarivorans]
MRQSIKLSTGDNFPAMQATLLDGSSINLNEAYGGADWQLLVVYRGRHCPHCTRYLNQLQQYLKDLKAIGISVSAVSADSKAQLEQHLNQLEITYPIAYGLTEEQMKQLGVYISTPRSEQETDHNFSEPALFVINQHGTLQMINISNAPFFRPELSAIVKGLTFVRAQGNYPIRGTVKY